MTTLPDEINETTTTTTELPETTTIEALIEVPTLYSDIFITGDEPMTSRLGDGIEVNDEPTKNPDQIDSSLTELLEEVDLDSLEQIMGELLPDTASEIAGDLKTDKGDDIEDYLEYELVEEQEGVNHEEDLIGEELEEVSYQGNSV